MVKKSVETGSMEAERQGRKEGDYFARMSGRN